MTALRRSSSERSGSRSRRGSAGRRGRLLRRRVARGLFAGLLALALAGVAHSVIIETGRLHRAEQWDRWVQAGMRMAPASVTRVMELPRRLHETSGVALGRRHPGLFWTHNDSGGDPVVYGLRPGQGVVAELRLRGAPVVDWEDLAAGPCPWDQAAPCIYVGDIGDNLYIRSSVVVMVFEEPDTRELVLPTTGCRGNQASRLDVAWSAVRLTYPDGARNAEGLAVTENGDVIVVEQDPHHRRLDVFRVPKPVFSAALSAGQVRAPVLLRHDGQLQLPHFGSVTAAAWAPGGELVVRTYSEALFYVLGADGWTERRPPCFVGHAGSQGEGLDVARPAVLYLTRERSWRGPPTLDLAVCGL